MNRCSRCLIPDTRPDTAFVDGVCSACLSHDRRKAIDWESRHRELVALLDQRRRKGAEFDCVVASSGGKDSHFIALKMIELGAKPLIVTATTCHLTPIGRANIDNLARYATTMEVTPNRSVRARLNRLGLELVGDISWPEHVSIFTTPFKVAARLDIPLIFYGESPQAHYGGPPGTDQAREMTRRWVSEFGGFLGLRPSDLVGQLGLTERDVEEYLPPSTAELSSVEAHFLGQYVPWDSHENAEVAKLHGMKHELPCAANIWPHENLDCSLTGLHCHGMYRKYGYGRAAAQLSVDIRAGLIERGRALEVVRVCDGLFPFVYAGVQFADSCEAISMTQDAVLAALDRFTTWELFRGVVDRRPILKEFPDEGLATHS